MKSSYWGLLLTFVGVILLDQVSKLWGESLPSLHYNSGFIMGYFAGQPDSIRIVAIGCFAAILFAVYILLIYLLPIRAWFFKVGLSLLMGGLFGNVLDRLALGKTRDFIPFWLGNNYYIFNLADVFIWMGALIIIWIMVRRDYLLWHEKSARKSFLVNPPEQIAFAIQLSWLIFSTCLIFGIFSFALVRTSVPEELIKSTPFAFSLVSLTLFLCFFGFLAGIMISHRRLGPLFAFELFVSDLVAGKSRPLKLREGDNYQHLSQTAEKLRHYLHQKKSTPDK